MKTVGRVWLPVVLAAVAALSAACLGLAPRPDLRPGAIREREVVVVVEGTPGLSFEGAVGTPTQSQSVTGTVPAQFTVKTTVGVVARFTKSVADGELAVRIMVDGKDTQRRSTVAPFGTILLTQTFSR